MIRRISPAALVVVAGVAPAACSSGQQAAAPAADPTAITDAEKVLNI